MLKAATAEK
jgi:hypothetical protein